ncbi:MAG: hypothetical protein VX757_12685, partial [Planctomycetota bacterium]|nr:hypothetical protein [Planctomycetota bacterium]
GPAPIKRASTISVQIDFSSMPILESSMIHLRATQRIENAIWISPLVDLKRGMNSFLDSEPPRRDLSKLTHLATATKMNSEASRFC